MSGAQDTPRPVPPAGDGDDEYLASLARQHAAGLSGRRAEAPPEGRRAEDPADPPEQPAAAPALPVSLDELLADVPLDEDGPPAGEPPFAPVIDVPAATSDDTRYVQDGPHRIRLAKAAPPERLKPALRLAGRIALVAGAAALAYYLWRLLVG